jgi:hypothetical protein
MQNNIINTGTLTGSRNTRLPWQEILGRAAGYSPHYLFAQFLSLFNAHSRHCFSRQPKNKAP